MIKRVFGWLLAAVVLFSLVGCTSIQTDPPAATQPPVKIETSAAETGAQESAPPAAGEAIVFNDAALEGLIREAIGKPQGDITTADAEKLTELELSQLGVEKDQPYINDLNALQYFTNLTYLGLGYAVRNAEDPNAPIDLSPIANLKNLTSLQMAGVVIDDLSPLAKLNHLISLTLFNGDQPLDLSPLAGLTSLEALTLRNNQIADLSPLGGLKNLRYLDLEGNQITDVTPLAGLTGLERLFLTDNPILDYSPLAAVRSDLVEWDFEAQAIPMMIDFQDAGFEEKVRQALEIPEGLMTYDVTRDVAELDLSDHGVDPALGDLRICNLDAIKYFSSLVKLDLQNNQLTNVSALRMLPKLTYLDLRGNQIVDFSPLLYCKNLTTLYLPEAVAGEYTPDFSVLSDIYGNLTQKNFTLQ